MKLIIRNSNGEITEQEITADMQFTPTAGEQYFFTGVENYTFNLTENNSTLDVHFLDNSGERINIVLHDMAELIQQNNPMDSFSMESTFGVSTNQAGDQAIDVALNNKELQSGEIVEALKDALSMDGSTLAGGAVIDDFQGLLDALDATATGETQNTAYNPLFDAVQTQEVDPVEASASDRPDNYGDNDNSIERAEGSYGNEEVKTDDTPVSVAEPEIVNEDVQALVADTEADLVVASLDVGEADISETTREVVDTAANEEAGIYQNEDGDYVQLQNVAVDTPMKEETVEATYKTETQEFENTREVEVEANLIMKEVSTEEPISTNITFVVDVSSSMSNVDLDLAEAGINKIISQYEELGDVNINIVQFYGNGNESTGWTSSDSLTVDDTLYRDKGGTDPEQGMRRAEQDFADAPQADQNIYIQMQDGNAYGSYEDDFEDYLSDFGDFINEQMDAFYTVGVNVSSLRDFNDINGVVDNPNDSIFARDASDLDEVVDGIAKVEVTEVIDVEAMEAAGYELRDGTWYETVTETFTDTREVQVVDVPEHTISVIDEDAITERGLTEIDGEYFEETEVEVDPIMTSVTEVTSVEYPIDFMAKLTDTDGSETLSDITVDNLPEGATLTGENVTDNGDGTYSVAVDENGEAVGTLTSNSELSEDQINDISAQVTSTENESGDTSTISVNGSGEFSFLDDVDGVDFSVVSENAEDIHKVNLEAETSQTLTLSVEDVVTSNDDHEMVIVGNDGDVIELEGEGWSRETGVAVDGEEGTFDHYTSTSTDGTVVDVYVESEITVQTDDFF